MKLEDFIENKSIMAYLQIFRFAEECSVRQKGDSTD